MYHGSLERTSSDRRLFAVSLSHVNLAENEYIQSVEVVVRCGRIVSIRRLLNDWDLEVQWDSLSLVKLTTQARHFSAGQGNVNKFADFITVEATTDPDCDSFAGKMGMSVTATVSTDMAGPLWGKVKKYELSEKEMILKPVIHRR